MNDDYAPTTEEVREMHKVVIDGIIYVPAIEAVASVDDVIQAMYESYMGKGKHWSEETFSLWVGEVNEDGEGDTFEEFAARIGGVTARSAQSEEGTDQ